MKISPSLLMFAPQRSIELALHWPPPQLLPPYTGQIQCRRGREKSTIVCIYNRNTSIWRTFFFIHLHIPDTVLFCPRWVNKFTFLDFKMILALLLLTRPWLARLRVTRHHSSSFPETCFLSFFFFLVFWKASESRLGECTPAKLDFTSEAAFCRCSAAILSLFTAALSIALISSKFVLRPFEMSLI